MLYRNTPDVSYHNGHPTVNENVAFGTLVAQVAAIDFDNGSSGEVGCQLQSALFHLDEVFPGEYNLSTHAEIDYEQSTNYTLNITCHDLGEERQLESSLVFTVYVLDENDNAPQIKINSFTETGEITFPHDTPSPRAVFMAVFDDDDCGQQEVECSLVRENPHDSLLQLRQSRIDPHQYKVLISAPVDDFPVGFVANVTIECHDIAPDAIHVTRKTFRVISDE